MPAVAPHLDWERPDYDPIIRERMERLRVIREQQAKGVDVLSGLREYYRDNIAQFIMDWGMTSDPRNAEVGLPIRVPFIMFPRQVDFIDWLIARWKGRQDGLCEKSRDMGVSWLCVGVSVGLFLFYPQIVIGFGSRKEEYVDRNGDPKSLFWKIREFINALPVEFQPAGWNSQKHAPFMRVLNPENGAAIVGEAGDNIGRGNRTAIYFKDESAFYERPELIDAALSQTSNCKVDVSTVNGVGNPFYRKRFGGRVPVFVFDWRDDPRKGEAWYAKQVRELEPHILATEVDRDYTAAIFNAFIPNAAVKAAQARGPMTVEAVGKLRVGVDPARDGDDAFAVTIRRGRLVLVCEETKQPMDGPKGAAFVKALLDPFGERPGQIAVDEIGIGASVVDYLRGHYGNIVVGVNVALRMDGGDDNQGGTSRTREIRAQHSSGTQYYNLRTLMYDEMREWLKGASIPVDPTLEAELCAVQYGYRGNSMLLESKDEMRKRGIKSPNKSDSLALTFADPRNPEDDMDADVILDPDLAAGRQPATAAGY